MADDHIAAVQDTLGFPGVEELAKAHSENQDTPCLLSIWFNTRDEGDVWLFEVLRNWPNADDGELLTLVEFGGTRDLPLPPDGRIKIVCANPDDARNALAADEAGIPELRQSIEDGDNRQLYLDQSSPQAISIADGLGVPTKAPSVH